MKCYKYIALVPRDDISCLVGMKMRQERLYIPKIGVLAHSSRKKGEVDYFSSDPKSLKEAERTINKKKDTKNNKYLGETDIPEDKINEFIKSLNTKKQAESDFQEKSRSLISLIN